MTFPSSYSKIRLEFDEYKCVARVTLNAPKANIVDRAMIEELTHAFDECAKRDLCAIVLGAEGEHFSFGASVKEHLPEQIAETLSGLHKLISRIASAPAPVIATVKGQCLGGGFELVLACDLVLCDETAVFACPEIKLGVFAPAASALLPVRIGASRAAAMLLTGDSFTAQQGLELGFVTAVAPAGGLQDLLDTWLDTHFIPRSVVGLRYAALAVRGSVQHAIDYELSHTEGMYLEQLMAEHDAVEGIHAFLEKRQPKWAKKPEPVAR